MNAMSGYMYSFFGQTSCAFKTSRLGDAGCMHLPPAHPWLLLCIHTRELESAAYHEIYRACEKEDAVLPVVLSRRFSLQELVMQEA
jgi:hypothetical protein